MSYEKAMKHTRNVRKRRKQANNYFGFSVGLDPWPSIRKDRYLAAILNVSEWFRQRNNGDASERAHTRECVRESIAEARELRVFRAGPC